MSKKITRAKDFIAEFNRLTGLKGADGKNLFKNGLAAFTHLNQLYFKLNDVLRYEDYNSFRAVKHYHKNKQT